MIITQNKLSAHTTLRIIIYQFMRILWLASLLLLLTQVASTQEPTTLIFYYEHQDQQDEDYLQVGLLVEAQGASLSSTINSASSTLAQIKTIAMEYCRDNKAKKGDCKESVEAERFAIEPKYHKVRREDTFQNFVVSHEVVVNVYNADKIGTLVDTFLKMPGVTLQGFEWAPFEEVDPEEAAIKGGLEEAEGLCEQLGLQLGRVIDVEEIIEAAAAPEAEEEGEQEEQLETVVYKLEVECVKAGKK